MQKLLNDLQQAAKDAGFQPTMYGVSKLTGIHEATLSKWVHRTAEPSSEHIGVIAKHLDMNPAEVLCRVRMEYAKTDEQRAMWEELARKWVATVRTLCALICCLSLTVASFDTAALSRSSEIGRKNCAPTSGAHSINMPFLRRRLSALVRKNLRQLAAQLVFFSFGKWAITENSL